MYISSLILGLMLQSAQADAEPDPKLFRPKPQEFLGNPRGPIDLPVPLAADGGRTGGGDDGGAEEEVEEEKEQKVNIGSKTSSKPPDITGSNQVTIDFVDTPLTELVEFMARITGRNFILTNELKGKVTIISHRSVTVPEAYEAFLSALESLGYTTVAVGKNTKIVQTSKANNVPLKVYEGSNIPYTDKFVTQIIQLDNVSVSEISAVVKDLSGSNAKVIAYAPTNTLIITDAAVNIRKVYHIISQMDVEAPRSKLRIIPLEHATASDVESIIKDLYGAEGSSTKSSDSSSTRRPKKSRAGGRDKDKTSTSSSSTNVGSEGKYIEKIISDERTNSLILMANEEALEAVSALIADLDVDVDPASRAQIHVIYLEHAKAEDVSQVLANLTEGPRNSRNSSARNNTRNSRSSKNRNDRSKADSGKSDKASSTQPSAVAALESGVKITSDENTNSLVIIATPDQIRYLKQVIEKLDIRRKQVFVEAVILELGSDDSFDVGIGGHLGKPNDDGGLSIFSSQLNGSSYGLSADLLSGMAMGVFGEPVSVAVSDGLGGSADMSVPAFGIALNALQSNSAVNILSTPNILTMDNEEASIVVGRNIPFPVSTGRDNNNNPIISYQREDVAITLKVTPQINESDYVTLTVFQEVQEVEEDSGGLDVATAGFITSKRSADTTVVVKDNQTVVIGGLIGATDTEVETKIPILGDLPIFGRIFRGKRVSSRKSNMLIFLTPHVIDDESDLEEVYRIKVAQRQEFIRRFYGKSRDQQESELMGLLSYSMNQIDTPSRYRGNSPRETNWEVISNQAPATEALEETSENTESEETSEEAPVETEPLPDTSEEP
jgi:general secretion pathway protein D